MPLTGRITEWNPERGYGYLQAEGRRVFLHVREFKERGGEPAVGDIVSFEMGQDRQGRPCAAQAALQDGGRQAAPRLFVRHGKTTPAQFLILVFLLLPGWAVYRRLGSLGVWYGAGWVLFISAVTYVIYADDKRRAKLGVRRESERSLHLWELLGGWPGAFFAQRRLRHKAMKGTYQFVFVFIIGLHQIVALDSLRNWEFLRGLPRVLGRLLDAVFG